MMSLTLSMTLPLSVLMVSQNVPSPISSSEIVRSDPPVLLDDDPADVSLVNDVPYLVDDVTAFGFDGFPERSVSHFILRNRPIGPARFARRRPGGRFPCE